MTLTLLRLGPFFFIACSLMVFCVLLWIGKRDRVPQAIWALSLALYAAGKITAAVCFWTARPFPALVCSLAADLIFGFLNSDYFNDGEWKKRWGKLRSSALTFVNQASFQQQSKEAFQ